MTAKTELRTKPRPDWYRKLFARMMNKVSGKYEQMVLIQKQKLFRDIQGVVLEIGPGTGPNLAYYPPGTRWIGIEPNPFMLPYIHKAAENKDLQIEIQEREAGKFDIPDNSVDVAVSTLVLCSVVDPVITVKEILRVLKPGGRFIFVEHVAASKGTGMRRIQKLVDPLWYLLSDSCHVTRDTWQTIEQAGFSRVDIEHFRIPANLTSPHIAGVAYK